MGVNYVNILGKERKINKQAFYAAFIFFMLMYLVTIADEIGVITFQIVVS